MAKVTKSREQKKREGETEIKVQRLRQTEKYTKKRNRKSERQTQRGGERDSRKWRESKN